MCHNNLIFNHSLLKVGCVFPIGGTREALVGWGWGMGTLLSLPDLLYWRHIIPKIDTYPKQSKCLM